jgi:hypothetical protein
MLIECYEQRPETSGQINDQEIQYLNIFIAPQSFNENLLYLSPVLKKVYISINY